MRGGQNVGDRSALPSAAASSATSVVAMACSQNRSCRQTSSESLSLKRAYIAPTDDLARRTISETVALSKPFSRDDLFGRFENSLERLLAAGLMRRVEPIRLD